ncbi:SGNH/GDSL hydrolase family protein [Psychrobacter sp.]|uniref:SGNH/GDSL hydrolase family protein n=1 Tax=Psychrobacter sp. TaxID=56811 RepID=UPI003F97D5D8
MAKLLTTQDMIEGHLDTQTLKEAVNEDKMVTSRLGVEYASVPMASRLLVENGLLGATPFSTYDEMIASTLVDGDYAIVTNDADLSKNGVYQKINGFWAFSEYNPLSQTMSYVNNVGDYAISDDRTINIDENRYNNSTDVLGFFVPYSDYTIAERSAAALHRIEVRENQVILMNTGSPNLAVSYGSNGLIAEGVKLTKADAQTAGGVTFFVIPKNANYMFFNTKIGSSFDITQTLVVNILEPELIKYRAASLRDDVARRDISDKIGYEELTKTGGVNIVPNVTTPNFYISKSASSYGQVLTNTTFDASVKLVPVTAGGSYSLYSPDINPDVFIIRALSDDEIYDGKPTLQVDIIDTDSVYIKKIIIPDGANYLILTTSFSNFDFDIRDTLWVNAGSYYDPLNVERISGYELRDLLAQRRIDNWLMSASSTLKGKSWALIGDSITQETRFTDTNYSQYVSNDVGGMTLYNYGISGSGFFDRSDVATTMTETDLDIITVFLGTNDFGGNRKDLGDFLDVGTTTVSGCINELLIGVINKYYSSKIAIITPLPRLSSWGVNADPNQKGFTLRDIVELLKKYANHYSIPYIDLYHESNLPVWVPAANTKYFTAPDNDNPDGLHPNDAGHRIIANKVKAFLESI